MVENYLGDKTENADLGLRRVLFGHVKRPLQIFDSSLGQGQDLAAKLTFAYDQLLEMGL